MRGHDATRGNKAFQGPLRNAAFERMLVVVWDECEPFIPFLLGRFNELVCSGRG